MLSCALQNSANQIYHRSDQDGLPATKTIHRETSPACSQPLLPTLTQLTYMREPNTAPPENVALIAPMMFDSGLVSKKCRKCGDWMTMVMTPES